MVGMERKRLLIIGAGPYGLAVAAAAKHAGLNYALLGRPMDLWKNHMPKGLLLRSPLSWHIDPLGNHTFESYIQNVGISPEKALPIPLELFLDYAQWFQNAYRLEVQSSLAKTLEYKEGMFQVKLEDGNAILAENTVVTPGLTYFNNIPQELVTDLPAERYSHSCDLVEFDFLREKRCLIVGGRTSAFEWAALITEQVSAEIHIVYRHETPRFARSDWAWVDPMIDCVAKVPGWFQSLSKAEQKRVRQRFWAEGRAKLEPWLEHRIEKGGVTPWPRSRVVNCVELPNGDIQVRLDSGTTLKTDHLILATGYNVDVSKVPYLSSPSIVNGLRTSDGFPVLDEAFQSSIPGLFFTGPPAIRDFGPFFGFLVGSPAAAKLIIERVLSPSASLSGRAIPRVSGS